MKQLALGSSVGLDPQRDAFLITCTNMLVSRNFCGSNATPNLHSVNPNLHSANPNLHSASRWNRGCVGSPGVRSHVGHVDFMLFVSISFALGSQRERSFQWNMGLSIMDI